MDLNIVIRADDPAAAVASLAALGIKLRRPDRPNPQRWHGRMPASVCVEPCAPGEKPSVAFGIRHGALSSLASAGVGITPNAPGNAVLDLGGAALTLCEHDGIVVRAATDVSLLPHAETLLAAARSDLAEAFARHEVEEPLLSGPQLMHGGWEPLFFLIVPIAARAEIQAILDRHALPAFRMEAVGRTQLDADTVDRLTRLAWDVTL